MSRAQRLTTAGIALAAIAMLLAPGIAAAKPPRSFFGVTSQRPLEAADFDRMQQAKVGTLRFELRWPEVDPAAGGTYDWSNVDPVVGDAAKRGIRALPYVFGTPSWVAKLDGRDCEDACGTFAPRGTQALAAWRKFLAAAARRYGPDGSFWSENPTVPKLPIRIWQLWNEQNSPSFYAPKPDPRAYAKLLHEGHKAIAAQDKGAQIVLGGMFGTPLGGRKPAIAAWDFLGRLYKRGAKRDFDAVAAHPYAPRFDDVVLQVDLLRDEIRKAHDQGADLRITELGWASGGPKHPLNRGKQGQAQRLTQVFRYFISKRRKLRIRSLDWYSWRDNTTAGNALCSWCPYSGLFDDDLNPKPALRAFTKFTGGS